MNTPRTDAACGWPWGHHGRIECGDLKWSPDGPFVHSSVARELERENAELREALKMAKRYVPPQAVTKEWKSKPVSECRLLDKIELVLGKEAQP